MYRSLKKHKFSFDSYQNKITKKIMKGIKLTSGNTDNDAGNLS